MQKEIWKPIKNWDKYFVSSFGRIKSTKNKNIERIMKQQTGKNGYLSVILTFNSKRERKSVHRIVAEAFLENKYNKEQVNHKDGNKKNNNIINLEWVSRSENAIHKYKVLGVKQSKKTPWNKRKIMCVETGYIFDMIRDAEKYFNVSNGAIGHCVGKNKTCKKKHFIYVI